MKKILTIFAIFLFIAGCAAQSRQLTQEEMNPGPVPTNYEQAIKNIVNPHLVDPYSAVYTFNKPSSGRNTMSGVIYGWHVCGTVNAKNRMGGYSGANPFYAMIKNDTVVRFIYKSILIPDTFSMGILSGAISEGGNSMGKFCYQQ
ncbi:MAG: hypothetical protein CVU71_03800 [Deltaproteobacteria bacterium HGW-Deltaproteobacteria-6]|jgi:hypothetical protein|nr:MAG: hypothetical protein CVU71_03800 [Deltaproteobacteria bacterium HGW-Deltaproteobacteria-6]